MYWDTQVTSYDIAEQMLDQMPVGIGIFALPSNELIAANNQFLAILDVYLERHWQQGKTIGHSLNEWLPSSLAEPLLVGFKQAAQQGKSLEFYNYHTTISENQVVYWNCSLEPIFDDTGRVTSILMSNSQITKQITTQAQLAEHHAIANQQYIVRANQRRQLEIIETVARSVQNSLDIETLGDNIVQTLDAYFTPLSIHLHRALPEKNALQLIAALQPQDGNADSFSYVHYDSFYYLSTAYKHHQALIRENLQTEAQQGIIPKHLPVVAAGGQGYICLPLWFNNYFEGTLTLVFLQPLAHDSIEIQTLTQCAISVAAALAHARLYTTVKQEQKRLRTIIDLLPEGVLLLDADGRISYINEAGVEIGKISAEEQIGLRAEEHPYASKSFHLDNQPTAPHDFPAVRALHGEIIHHQEGKIIRPDASACILRTNAVPLRSEDGIINGAVAIFSDITQEKSIEQMRDEFFSIASHELRTPITAMQGFAEILQMLTQQGNHLSTPRSIRALHGIIAHSQHLTRLLEDLLELSRIEHDLLFIHLKLHDIVLLILHVFESQKLITRQHTLTLVFDGLQAHDSLITTIDEDHFVQILNNLINNAVKYSPSGSTIEIGLHYNKEMPNHYRLWVKDEGIGIDAKEIPHIFTRFHRASNLDHSISGLGVGLYLVRELVHRHQGKVWVESQPGKGSTFYVELPFSHL